MLIRLRRWFLAPMLAELRERDAELRALTEELFRLYQDYRMLEKRLWKVLPREDDHARMEVNGRDGALTSALLERKGFR